MPPSKKSTFMRSRISERHIRHCLDEMRQDPPQYRHQYSPLFTTLISALTVPELRHYLEKYQTDFNKSQWSAESLDAFGVRKCTDYLGEIHDLCYDLDNIGQITRFLLCQLGTHKATFSECDNYRLDLDNNDINEKLEDSVLMVKFVQGLAAALDRSDNDADTARACYRTHIYYTRKNGLSVFSIDRHDSKVPDALPEACYVYKFDVLPFLFVRPINMEIYTLVSAFRVVLDYRVRATHYPKTPLHHVVVRRAEKQGLRRDHFTDFLKEMLHFDINTLRRMPREPHLEKYPALHNCPFNKVIYEEAPGLWITIKAKKLGNIVETLYAMEMRGQIVVNENCLRKLAEGRKNEFRFFEWSPEKQSTTRATLCNV